MLQSLTLLDVSRRSRVIARADRQYQKVSRPASSSDPSTGVRSEGHVRLTFVDLGQR